MEIDINDVLSALDDYAEASAKLRQMRSEYTGHSPSYHLYSWQEASDKAKQRVKEALDAYIDARVEAKEPS